MNFSLLICTYMRPKAIIKLLESVNKQTLYPNDIIIIDGSTNRDTEIILKDKAFKNLSYYKVEADNRGLTKQRNFGITHVGNTIDIVCFLDDDVVLEPHYFEQLLSTYKTHPEALAVGGYITNEIDWQKQTTENDTNYFYYDGWQRKEPLRFKIRRLFGVLPDVPPGFMPAFSNGRSVSFLPPSGKVYPVEQIMGGVSSYKKEVFETLNFSTYFEGYGLYEDADFSLRIAKQGMLYINTAAQLAHHHEPSGRPNKFSYGKMVIRNGWYVWRVKYSSPLLKAKLKFYATSILLTLIRATNIITTSERKKALTETLGRVFGLFSLIFNKPNIK
ncbi:glycosyltransferase family 2 protein [Algibacter sp. L4_22]|uniref:glycosyltransferase family 2 protein n=1 Tax=Algibacter sp. L4_22 TaxID=2942477 RepID=UPI00201B8782|nr:glycosyltransferase family 2 protein [Algibacter sp. L4_22]MCL5128731.1 glycosyltransferase family 2 protein [Algibacter sp. L4_22]